MNTVHSGVEYKPLTAKERMKKHFTETVVPVFVISLVPIVFLGIFLLWPSMEAISIKKDIAELHQISYSNVWELENRVKFYQFDAVNAGDFSGIYCEIDGSRYGVNDDISRRIRSYVDSWCD